VAILFTQRFASAFWTFVLNRVRAGFRQGAKEHPSLFVVCGDALHQFDGALAQCFTPCREPDAEFRQIIGCQAIEKGAPIERRGLFHAIA
jgi:hypothetical protein